MQKVAWRVVMHLHDRNRIGEFYMVASADWNEILQTSDSKRA